MTCACWNQPFGTRLKVTCLATGKSVIVTVTDRGPAKRLGRAIDLAEGAFAAIADKRKGVIEVRIEKLNETKNQK